jgi:hypothetical protein
VQPLLRSHRDDSSAVGLIVSRDHGDAQRLRSPGSSVPKHSPANGCATESCR